MTSPCATPHACANASALRSCAATRFHSRAESRPPGRGAANRAASPPKHASVTTLQTRTAPRAPGTTPRVVRSYAPYSVGRHGCRPETAASASTSARVAAADARVPFPTIDFAANAKREGVRRTRARGPRRTSSTVLASLASAAEANDATVLAPGAPSAPEGSEARLLRRRAILGAVPSPQRGGARRRTRLGRRRRRARSRRRTTRGRPRRRARTRPSRDRGRGRARARARARARRRTAERGTRRRRDLLVLNLFALPPGEGPRPSPHSLLEPTRRARPLATPTRPSER